MITREQVADLQPGDVVELISVQDWNVNVRGELRRLSVDPASLSNIDALTLGPGLVVRRSDGAVAAMWLDGHYSLVVVHRAPRLYVNHPRIRPVAGDVARAADQAGTAFYVWQGSGPFRWIWPNGHTAEPGHSGLLLLVDGETGQVVL